MNTASFIHLDHQQSAGIKKYKQPTTGYFTASIQEYRSTNTRILCIHIVHSFWAFIDCVHYLYSVVAVINGIYK